MNATVAIVARTARFSLLRYVPVGPRTGARLRDRQLGRLDARNLARGVAAVAPVRPLRVDRAADAAGPEVGFGQGHGVWKHRRRHGARVNHLNFLRTNSPCGSRHARPTGRVSPGARVGPGAPRAPLRSPGLVGVTRADRPGEPGRAHRRARRAPARIRWLDAPSCAGSRRSRRSRARTRRPLRCSPPRTGPLVRRGDEADLEIARRPRRPAPIRSTCPIGGSSAFHGGGSTVTLSSTATRAIRTEVPGNRVDPRRRLRRTRATSRRGRSRAWHR